MTLVRKSRQIVFECDECGAQHPSFTDDFHDALDDFKEDGGTARLVQGDWQHFCKDCS